MNIILVHSSLALEPKPGHANRLGSYIFQLCGEDAKLTSHVLDVLAAIVQHPALVRLVQPQNALTQAVRDLFKLDEEEHIITEQERVHFVTIRVAGQDDHLLTGYIVAHVHYQLDHLNLVLPVTNAGSIEYGTNDVRELLWVLLHRSQLLKKEIE